MKARDFKLAKVALLGLVLCTGALAVCGVLSILGDLSESFGQVMKAICTVAFAGIAGFALFIAQTAAACFQYLLDKPNAKPARNVAALCALVCSLVSVGGVFLGDSILRGDRAHLPPVELMVLGGFLLAFIKPSMSFVISACDGAERASVATQDAVLEAKDARIRDLEQQLRALEKDLKKQSEAPVATLETDACDATPSRPRRASAHAARSVANAMRRQPPSASRRDKPALEQRVAKRAPPLSEQQVRDAISALTADDKVVSLRNVAKVHEARTGEPCPISRVERSPGKPMIVKAA